MENPPNSFVAVSALLRVLVADTNTLKLVVTPVADVQANPPVVLAVRDR